VTIPGRHAVLVGATASGKSDLAMALARRDPAWELVSADSMQVYRGMDIGTAKPTAAEQAEVPHHLIDVFAPSEDASVAWFQHAAGDVLADLEARGRRGLIVGGTALWVQAVLDDLQIPGQYPDVRAILESDPDTEALHAQLEVLDPAAAEKMNPTNRRRILRALEVTMGSGQPFSSFGPGLGAHPPTPFVVTGLARDAVDLRGRIAARYDRQMAAGLLDEVAALRDLEPPMSRTARQALGYKELLEHLDGACSLEEALDLAVRRTVRFARRQRAWFRRDPRIQWIEAPPEGDDIDPNLLVDALTALVG
jgi:tRNA dimethylallyltransferase